MVQATTNLLAYKQTGLFHMDSIEKKTAYKFDLKEIKVIISDVGPFNPLYLRNHKS
jgi:hypothetical protein